jgi:hypothetical protein
MSEAVTLERLLKAKALLEANTPEPMVMQVATRPYASMLGWQAVDDWTAAHPHADRRRLKRVYRIARDAYLRSVRK